MRNPQVGRRVVCHVSSPHWYGMSIVHTLYACCDDCASGSQTKSELAHGRCYAKATWGTPTDWVPRGVLNHVVPSEAPEIALACVTSGMDAQCTVGPKQGWTPWCVVALESNRVMAHSQTNVSTTVHVTRAMLSMRRGRPEMASNPTRLATVGHDPVMAPTELSEACSSNQWGGRRVQHMFWLCNCTSGGTACSPVVQATRCWTAELGLLAWKGIASPAPSPASIAKQCQRG